MHILHIEEGFIPNLGYQINLLTKYMALAGHRITILTTTLDKMVEAQKVYLSDNIMEQDNELFQKYGIEVIRIPVKRMISNRCHWDKSVFEKIMIINPDIVYLHGNDTFIAIQYFLRYLKKIDIPVVTDSHMLDAASKNRFSKYFRLFYRVFITPILVRNQIPVIRVADDPFINKAYNIPFNISPLLSFGSDIELFQPSEEVKKSFRTENNIKDNDFVIVYAGKLSEDKDGLFFAESIQKKIKTKNRDVVFIIVGTTTGEYGQKVEELFSKSENKIIRFPLQKYTDLPMFFQVSDVALIPSAASLTFYDMQSCGLPIIWSDLPVNIKRTQNNNGLTFAARNSKDMRKQIVRFVDMDKNELAKISENARTYILDNYSYQEVTDKYLKIINDEIIKRKKLGQYK
jgi:glycosyltransferase involved in cell wall biosynthesis